MPYLNKHLDQLEKAGLVNVAQLMPELEYVFRHALTQEAAYESLLKKDRRLLHQSVAEALIALYPDRVDELAASLAYHYTAAGENEKAIAYAQRAARRAENMYAYAEAIQQLSQALDLIKGEQLETRMAVLEQLADDHILLGMHKQAIPLYQQALKLWSETANADRFVAVRLHRKSMHAINSLVRMEDFQRFEMMFQSSRAAGLKLTEGQPPHPETVLFLTALSEHVLASDIPADIETAERYVQAAITIAEQIDTPYELSAALGVLAKCYGIRGLFRKRLDVSLRRLTLSQHIRFDRRERVVILNAAADALLRVGEYAQALPYLLEAEALASPIRALDQQLYSIQLQTECLLGLDRWKELLEIDKKRLILEQDYSREQVGRLCFHEGVAASVYALQGAMKQAVSMRQEIYAFMNAVCGDPSGVWSRSCLY